MTSPVHVANLKGKSFRCTVCYLSFGHVLEQRPSWIHHLGFFNYLKPLKSANIDTKVIKNSKRARKWSKTVKLPAGLNRVNIEKGIVTQTFAGS